MKRYFAASLLFVLINQYAAAQTPIAENKTMAKDATNTGGNSIQSLIASKKEAEASADKWNNWYVMTVAIAAMAAVAVFVAQLKAITYARELATAQDDLMAEKDRLAAADSLEKKLEIERLHAINLELEATISRRGLIITNESRDRLKKHAGTKYVLEWENDAESRRFAGALDETLRHSDWIRVNEIANAAAKEALLKFEKEKKSRQDSLSKEWGFSR